MDSAVAGAALLSAFLHAAWNAAVRASTKPQDAVVAQAIGSGLASAPLLILLPLPTPAALPWLAASTVCNLLTMLAYVQGYTHGGGFGVVYPVARAVSPLLVTLLARVLVGERLSMTGYVGVALVSAGVALLAAGDGRRRPTAVAYALAAGVCTAAYTVCDAQGARLSPSVVGYGTAVATLNAVVFGSVYRLQGGGSIRAALASHRSIATFGAAAGVLSYFLILWVWARTQIAVGAALRDTSIVFAALIAAVVLKEPVTRTRAGAVALVAAGAGTLRFA